MTEQIAHEMVMRIKELKIASGLSDNEFPRGMALKIAEQVSIEFAQHCPIEVVYNVPGLGSRLCA